MAHIQKGLDNVVFYPLSFYGIGSITSVLNKNLNQRKLNAPRDLEPVVHHTSTPSLILYQSVIRQGHRGVLVLSSCRSESHGSLFKQVLWTLAPMFSVTA